MNAGQLTQMVKLAVNKPKRVSLINRVDGQMITDKDIKKYYGFFRDGGCRSWMLNTISENAFFRICGAPAAVTASS
jgi:hypothetical protein